MRQKTFRTEKCIAQTNRWTFRKEKRTPK